MLIVLIFLDPYSYIPCVPWISSYSWYLSVPQLSGIRWILWHPWVFSQCDHCAFLMSSKCLSSEFVKGSEFTKLGHCWSNHTTKTSKKNISKVLRCRKVRVMWLVTWSVLDENVLFHSLTKIGFFLNTLQRFCRCGKASMWVEMSNEAIRNSTKPKRVLYLDTAKELFWGVRDQIFFLECMSILLGIALTNCMYKWKWKYFSVDICW